MHVQPLWSSDLPVWWRRYPRWRWILHESTSKHYKRKGMEKLPSPVGNHAIDCTSHSRSMVFTQIPSYVPVARGGNDKTMAFGRWSSWAHLYSPHFDTTFRPCQKDVSIRWPKNRPKSSNRLQNNNVRTRRPAQQTLVDAITCDAIPTEAVPLGKAISLYTWLKLTHSDPEYNRRPVPAAARKWDVRRSCMANNILT